LSSAFSISSYDTGLYILEFKTFISYSPFL
jgi:DNA-directed RNA polymerase subunit E'/Rpb7